MVRYLLLGLMELPTRHIANITMKGGVGIFPASISLAKRCLTLSIAFFRLKDSDNLQVPNYG